MSTIYGWIMDLVGTDRGGWVAPPEPKALRYVVEGRRMRRARPDERDYEVITSNNDGFELWLGSAYKWNHHMGSREVRALFWWLLWEWYGRARWFGLRRPIYYWALRRKLARRSALPVSEPTP